MPISGNLITELAVTDLEGPVTVKSANNTSGGIYTAAPGVVNFADGATCTFAADGSYTFDEGTADEFPAADPAKTFDLHVRFKDSAGQVAQSFITFQVNGIQPADQPPTVGTPGAVVIVNP